MFAEDPCGMDFQNNWSKAHCDKCFWFRDSSFMGIKICPSTVHYQSACDKTQTNR